MLQKFFFLMLFVPNVISFSPTLTTKILKEKYTNQKLNFEIYDENVNLFVKNFKVINKNKFFYEKTLQCVKTIFETTKTEMKMESICDLNDRIYIEWKCSLNQYHTFTSLYILNPNGKIVEHTVDWIFHEKVYPRILKPIRIRSSS